MAEVVVEPEILTLKEAALVLRCYNGNVPGLPGISNPYEGFHNVIRLPVRRNQATARL